MGNNFFMNYDSKLLNWVGNIRLASEKLLVHHWVMGRYIIIILILNCNGFYLPNNLYQLIFLSVHFHVIRLQKYTIIKKKKKQIVYL